MTLSPSQRDKLLRMKDATARPSDAEYGRQLKEVAEMLNEGIANLKAGRVHTREEVRCAIDEAFKKRDVPRSKRK